MIGAEMMVKALENENVKYVFGYPGVSICPFFDKLIESEIKPVLVRTEQASAHCASGYARAASTVGVCVASSGPGATNLITGIATAFADSIPMVVITGQVKSEQIGSDMFQEADITGACESFVKYSYLIKKTSDIPRVFREAFYIANSGRKGPVLIDIPVDIQLSDGGEFFYPEKVSLRTYKPTYKGHSVQIKKVITTLETAKRPILCVGGGVISSGAQKEVISFAEKYSIPIVSTMMGIGVCRSDNPLYIGMVGNNGRKYANKAMNESDVLIMVGARVADRAVKQPDLITQNKILIHIDIDPAEIGKNAGPSIPIVGDAKNVFADLNKLECSADFTDWLNILKGYTKTRELSEQESTDKFINPRTFVSKLSEKLSEKAIYVSDVGQNQIYSCANYVAKNGKFLTSGGMGTMGYSIPAAIGAKFGKRNREVVAVCGDGSFQMFMNELATIKYNHLDIKIIVMNNNNLGMIKQYQHEFYANRYTMYDLGDYPKLEDIAAAYEMKYVRALNMDELDGKLNEALSSEGPVIFEVKVDPDAFMVS
ncbi:MAG: biosynthetic-type acetolactate synthase large subunit [Lachnospiraceae bacterium]|nr:biosynthetic-type acetolactate synthase large subunit [Lachnospiraceae bacterium]